MNRILIAVGAMFENDYLVYTQQIKADSWQLGELEI